MIYVLDACALIAYLNGEPGDDTVARALGNPDNLCYAHAVNLCEVHYDFCRAGGVELANEVLADLFGSGVKRRDDMDEAFCVEASSLKAVRRRVSLADCFAVALASRLGGMIPTADHHEFDALAADGAASIEFIR